MPDARAPKRRASALAQLTSTEAAEILTQLLEAHPALRVEAEGLARGMLDEVSAAILADEIETDLRALGIDDLNERAGPHRGGYTDPGDAAWELLNEALDRYIQDLRRRLATGRDRAAMEMLRGILAGLYAVRDDEGGGGVLDWAPDFPQEAAAKVARIWRDAGRALPREALDEGVPDWAGGIARG